MLNTGVIFVIVLLMTVVTILWGHLNLLRGRLEGMQQMVNMAKVMQKNAENEAENDSKNE